MQGSYQHEGLHDQNYRDTLVKLLKQHLPDADIYDPLADHQASLQYDPQTARQVFMQHNTMCGEVDLVIAFVPEASMGTAVEIWEAHRNGRTVLTISPLEHNWAVRFLSDFVYHDIDEFKAELTSGKMLERFTSFNKKSKPTE